LAPETGGADKSFQPGGGLVFSTHDPPQDFHHPSGRLRLNTMLGRFTRMALYKEDFPKGAKVRIKSRGFLDSFRDTWRYHTPLQPEQVEFADRVSEVESVGFYHGGDVLYTLRSVPGVWHEQCLAIYDNTAA
jgi:hypothetical protein